MFHIVTQIFLKGNLELRPSFVRYPNEQVIVVNTVCGIGPLCFGQFDTQFLIIKIRIPCKGSSCSLPQRLKRKNTENKHTGKCIAFSFHSCSSKMLFS